MHVCVLQFLVLQKLLFRNGYNIVERNHFPLRVAKYNSAVLWMIACGICLTFRGFLYTINSDLVRFFPQDLL